MSNENFDKNFAYNFALGDSKHDMGTIMVDGTNTSDAVDNTRPKGSDYIGINTDISHPSEDAMLLEYAFGGGEVPKDKSQASDYVLKGEVGDVYEHFSLNDDTAENLFEKIFSQVQAIDNLTLIVDFGYSNIREQLNNYNAIGRAASKTVYWYQCPETDLDPAEKTKFHSGKFFGTNVCFATSHPAQQTIFPQWGENLNGHNVDIYNYKHGDNSDFHEKMFFSNYHCQLSYENKAEKDYKKQKAWLLMKSPTNKYSYVTSTWAAIKKGPYEKAEHALYKKGGLALFKQYKNNVALDIDTYSNEGQIIGKRIGDGGQALVCLNEIDKLIKRTGRRPVDQQEVILNNNKNVFVSHDRLAILFALKIRVPIVIWNRMKSFVVFINKKLKTDEKVFGVCQTALNKYKAAPADNSLKNAVLPSSKQYKTKPYKTWFDAQITGKKTAIENELSRLADEMKVAAEGGGGNADEKYRNYIKNVCYFSRFLINYNSLESLIDANEWTTHQSNVLKLGVEAGKPKSDIPTFDGTGKVTTADESKLQNYKTFYSIYEKVVSFNAIGKEKEIERLIDELELFVVAPIAAILDSSVPSNIRRDVKETKPYFWSKKLQPPSARKTAPELSLVYQDKATQHFGLKSLLPLLKGMYSNSSNDCKNYFKALESGGTNTYKHIHKFFVAPSPIMSGGSTGQHNEEILSDVNTRSFTGLYEFLTSAPDVSNFKQLLTTPEEWSLWINTNEKRIAKINEFIKENEHLFTVFGADSIKEASIQPFFQHIDEILNFFRINFLIISDVNSSEILFERGEGESKKITLESMEAGLKTNLEYFFNDVENYEDESDLDTILNTEYSNSEVLDGYAHSTLSLDAGDDYVVADSLLNNYDSESVLAKSTNFINNYHEGQENRPAFPREDGPGQAEVQGGGVGQTCLKHINNDDFTCKCASCNGGTNAGIETSDDIASMVKIFSRVVNNKNACKYFKKLTEEIYVDAEPNTINNIKVCLFGLFANINSTDKKVLKINEILDGLLDEKNQDEIPKGKGIEIPPSKEDKPIESPPSKEGKPSDDDEGVKASPEPDVGRGGKKTKKKRKNKKRKKTKRHTKYNKKTKKRQKGQKKRKSTK